AASLVIVRPVGRYKYHYLNAVPLQEVMDRWIEPLTRKPLTRAVVDAKRQLEGASMPQNPTSQPMDEKPSFVLETYIRTTPSALWEALTDGAFTPQYYFGTTLKTSLEPGTGYRYESADGSIMLKGEIVSVDPGKRLEMTFIPAWAGPNAATTRNVYEIEHQGESCKLTILHFGEAAEQAGVREGWAKIAAGLKTLLETGSPLAIA
ncbi:MAG: SRPBCC domain-containing protein, partial [Pseudomonadota bacterium]